ncbi:MAG TPA: iron-containing redox enzyme family protein [Chloroflexota bacterium]|jgi:hypothetical protein
MAVADEIKVYNEIVRSVAAYWDNPPETHALLNGWQDWPRERLLGMVQIQVKQQHPWTCGFPRWLGHIYGNCPDASVRRFLLEDLSDEEGSDDAAGDGHIDLHRRLGHALGLSDADLDEGPFVPEVTAICLSMEHISLNRPWLEALACIMGTEVLTLARIPRLYPDMEEYDRRRAGVAPPALLEIYRVLGLQTDDLAFYWAHDVNRLAIWEGREPDYANAGTEGRHQEAVIRTLTEHARTPDERRRVAEMVRLGHELFWMRWHGMARAMREYVETGTSRYGPLPS